MKVSEDKTSKEQKTPGVGKTRALKDLNDNEVKSEEKSVGSKKMEPKKETKGAEAVVDLKAEAAKRRQSMYTKLFPFLLCLQQKFRTLIFASFCSPR